MPVSQSDRWITFSSAIFWNGRWTCRCSRSTKHRATMPRRKVSMAMHVRCLVSRSLATEICPPFTMTSLHGCQPHLGYQTTIEIRDISAKRFRQFLRKMR